MAYPALFYPDIYILKGGFRAYHEHGPERCVPNGGYVEMNDERFKKECREGAGFNKRQFSSR